jgi:hypothetical protein
MATVAALSSAPRAPPVRRNDTRSANVNKNNHVSAPRSLRHLRAAHHQRSEPSPAGDDADQSSTTATSRTSKTMMTTTSTIPRRAALTAAVGLFLGVGIYGIPQAATASSSAAAAAASASRESPATSLAKLAAQEPDAEIAVDLWDEVVKLAAASGELATPAGGVWSAARGDCLGQLRRWGEAERAYAAATEALSSSEGGLSGAAAGSEAALRLAMAHDGRSLVGLYMSNQVKLTHSLKAPGFNP